MLRIRGISQIIRSRHRHCLVLLLAKQEVPALGCEALLLVLSDGIVIMLLGMLRLLGVL